MAARPQVPFNIVTRLPSFEEIMNYLPLMDDVPKAEKARFQVFLNRRNQRRVRFERRRADGEDAEASASEAEEPSICEKFEEFTELQQGQLRAQGLYANDLKDILDGRASSFAIVPRQVVVLPDNTEFVLPSGPPVKYFPDETVPAGRPKSALKARACSQGVQPGSDESWSIALQKS